jgi:hypothetical protein
MQEQDESESSQPRHDPAAPHTAPFPAHVPRWVAWLVLIGLAASAVVCVRVVVG